MYKSEVKGKGCIVARVVADSISSVNGQRVTTLEVEYPRFILAELNTHRMFSRNSASSRAIPISKMIEQVRSNPAVPIHWGANQKGMQASEELINDNLLLSESAWKSAANDAAGWAEMQDVCGLHKQIVNRLLEPFQIMKTVITATEWNNFFALRDHKDSQPEIAELARVMRKAMEQSKPETLKPGEYHLPYIETFRASDGDARLEYIVDRVGVSLDEALKVSASCCAQVSYRLLDQSVDKALGIYDQLVNSKPAHSSPFEHQCTPMDGDEDVTHWEIGVTHMDGEAELWSGNLKGWIQHRQLIKDNVVKG